MAVDAALLAGVQAGGPAVLRLYGWETPTLSLGYFQRAAERATHRPSEDCVLIRRESGGGAILHDSELTYALILPQSSAWAAKPPQLYRHVHGTLVELLERLGRKSELWHPPAVHSPAPNSAGPEPFLCFARRADGDWVMEGHKVGGSAQRRKPGGLLQHGSLLLDRSEFAPELPGLNQLGEPRFTPESFAAAWLPLLAERSGFAWVESELTPQENATAAELRETRYAAAAWTQLK